MIVIMIAPMIVIVVLTLSVVLIVLILIVVLIVIVPFPSESRYWKQQSSRYCANNRELANHWFLQRCVSARGQTLKASLQLSQ
jgi:hypothetical protein